MKIFRASERDLRVERRDTFTGDVLLTAVVPTTDGVTVSDVVFTPGSRTYWHSHENGQLIIVTAGRGFLCAEGERPQVVTAGDVIWTPPGQRHWHGAAPDSCLIHTAISLGITTWGVPVTDTEYQPEAVEGAGHGR
ncbi:MAG: cupin domain-containing protein [Micromonosporaceae bacterium]|nr:cupin domain-containing protein [Micromonosporaceae bacterium]